MTSQQIGILAEDRTDCDTMEVLIRRIIGGGAGQKVGVHKRAGKGCSNLRRKAEAWLHELKKDHCTTTVLLHDLDRLAEETLRKQLQTIAVPTGVQMLICIPMEELEAWFWADPRLIATITEGRGKASAAPERIISPKEALSRLSRGANQKSRYDTSKNPDLARDLDLTLCAQRCRAFRELRDFVGALGH